MALGTPVVLATGRDTTNGTGPYNFTTSRAAAAGELIVAFVLITGTTPPTGTTVSGMGLTWTNGSETINRGIGRLHMFWGVGTPSGTTFTVTLPGGFSATGVNADIIAITGADTTTPLPQTPAQFDSTSANTGTATLGSTPAASSLGLVGAFAAGAGGSFTWDASFTELTDATNSGPNLAMGSAYDLASPPQAATPVASSSAAAFLVIYAEVAEAAGSTDANHNVPLQTVTVSDLNPVATGGANHNVPLGTVGASVMAVAATGGAGHTVPLQTVSAGLQAVSVAGGANYDVPLQSVVLSMFAVTVTTGSGDISVLVPLQEVALTALTGTVVTGANFDTPLLQVPLAQFTTLVQTGVDFQVPMQSLVATALSVAVATGANFDVPLKVVTISTFPVLLDTTAANVDVPLLTLRLTQNNGQPMAMVLVRQDGKVVERYRMPLR